MGVCRGIIGTGNARSLRTKYIFRVRRGLAPAVNSQRIPRRGQAPALPYKSSLQTPILFVADFGGKESSNAPKFVYNTYYISYCVQKKRHNHNHQLNWWFAQAL